MSRAEASGAVTRAVVPPVGDGFRQLDGYVYDALLEAILQRRLVPGERLVLDELAEQLKVSRTPVRDALSRLASEGLVARAGRRGFTITALTPKELSDLYDLRLMCELYAIEKGIAAADPKLLDEMTEFAHQCLRSAESGNRRAAMLSDREFHRLLVTLGDNQRLTDLVARLNIHIQTLRVEPGPLPAQYTAGGSNARREYPQAEHLLIVEAIRAGDLAVAKQRIRAHVTGASERAVASMQASAREANRRVVGPPPSWPAVRERAGQSP